METYLEAEPPKDLCESLFLSFMKRPTELPKPTIQTSLGKGDFNVKDCAAMASQTVCAPITHQSTEMVDKSHDSSKHHGIAEKLHGLTEKLHGLGHSRHDSGGDIGRRSRAGSICKVLFYIP